MIAIKATVRRRTVEAIAIGEDQHGQPISEEIEVDVLEPEGLERRRDFCPTAPLVEDEEQIIYVEDDAVPEGARRCVPSDFPPRPGVAVEGFPPVVPSGWYTCRVDADGRLVDADPSTGKVYDADNPRPPPEPVEDAIPQPEPGPDPSELPTRLDGP